MDKGCLDFNFLVTKAHPEHLHNDGWFENIMIPCFGRYGMHLSGIRLKQISAIFIVRDPWKAIFSLYQLLQNKENEDMHIAHVLLENWVHHQWAGFVESNAQKWLREFEMMQAMEHLGQKYVIVKYEYLTNLKDTNIAINEMNKILRYLYTDDYYDEMKDILMQRMNCIFPTLMLADYGRLGTFHRKKVNETKELTITRAYQYLIKNHESLICNAWDRMKTYAERYGYKNLDGVEC